jgi:NAD(P)-dependent dehydrogenase (short-subunit alcohol dehydrogenase family)
MKKKIEHFFSVKKKVILVVGGTRGIGLTIAKDLLSLGSKVVTLGRSKLKRKNHIICSVTSEEEILNAFNLINKKFGKIDVLINVAGISIGIKKSQRTQNINDFKNTLDTNLIGIYKVCSIAIKFLKKNSSIINVSSIASQFGFPKNPGYISSKSGLCGLTRSMAYDYAKYGIRVNNLIPGYIKTQMTIQSFKDKKLYNLRKSKTLLNRWGVPKDLIGAVIFLSSSASSYVTGSNITVDGGWSVKGI